jgi:transcriptional regulator of arginine metabolism
MSKKRRHQEILDIVRSMDISNHDELLHELKKRSIIVTQATISRDIVMLGLKKTRTDEDIPRYEVPEKIKDKKFAGVFAGAVKTINIAMNTVVIKTYAGMASAVCIALELKDIPIIVGTIAGDDTIFVMTRSERDAKELVEKLRKLL